MKYLVSDIERLGEEIDALPPPDPGRRKVGKKEAVILLANKLKAAARRGFSTAELLEVLATKGLKIHVDTLRAAFRDVGRVAATGPARGQRKAGEPKGARAEAETVKDKAADRPRSGGSDDDGPDQRTATEPRASDRAPVGASVGGRRPELSVLPVGAGKQVRTESGSGTVADLGTAPERGAGTRGNGDERRPAAFASGRGTVSPREDSDDL
jgi:hypothetical protein